MELFNLNHHRIWTRCRDENRWSSINYSFRLHMTNFIKQQAHLEYLERKLLMKPTGVWPKRNVIVVRPSSRSKDPKFCNRTPDLNTLFWSLKRTRGSVKFTWSSRPLANCCIKQEDAENIERSNGTPSASQLESLRYPKPWQCLQQMKIVKIIQWSDAWFSYTFIVSSMTIWKLLSNTLNIQPNQSFSTKWYLTESKISGQ